MINFMLGVGASIVAGIILFLLQPFLPQSPLSNFWNYIQSKRLHINEKSSNKAINYAAEGRGDGAILISLLILGITCFSVSLYVLFSVIGIPVTLDELLRVIISLLVLVVGAFFFRELGTISTAMQLNRLYLWKMTILSPHMTLKEEKELRAMWALMKNKNDYEEINGRLDSLAQMNGIELPEPSLKVRI